MPTANEHSTFEVIDLRRQTYQDAYEVQMDMVQEIIQGNRSHTLLLVEHDPVLTLGANFHAENLLFPVDWYKQQNIDVVKTDRGGDVTYHGPGQLVAYPLFDLNHLGKDLHKWMRNLEETVIHALSERGLEGERLPVNSGVWVNDRKICAIGIKIRKWVSMHGIALNCNIDLGPFDTIVPCGIRSHGVTSLSQEMEQNVTVESMKPHLIHGFEAVFGLTQSAPVLHP